MSGLIFTSIIIISIIVTIALIVLLWKLKTIGNIAGKINYRFFFILGIILMPIGLSCMVVALFTNLYIAAPGLPFLTLGLAYIAIGLANRDKWKNQ